MSPHAFIPDRDASFYLLRGHLPPVAENVARAYIEAYTAPGDLVIDPFAHTPSVARAAFECGRRAVAVEANPLVAFCARVQAAPPAARDLEDALQRLGDAPKAIDPHGRRFAQPGAEAPGQEELVLRDHLDGLYLTTCAQCGERVPADLFVFSPEIGAPVQKGYRCPHDGAHQEPTTDADRAAYTAFERRGFHYHYVWNRISEALGGDLLAPTLRDLLALYSPRNLYALVTLWLKIESQLADHPAREGVLACFVHALDRGTLLYPEGENWPTRKIPARALERNVWRLVEEAAQGLGGVARRLPLALSPRIVLGRDEPAVYVGPGSARGLAASDNEPPNPASGASLVLSAPPHLDPIFWGLSYLWTRWIWGKREAEPLAAFLEPDRQRWPWYAEALTAALRSASKLLRPEGRLILTFPSGSHGVVEAVCLAAGANPFELEALLFRPHRGANVSSEMGALRGDYRLLFRLSSPREEGEPWNPIELARQTRSEALRGGGEAFDARGEPLPFAWLHHAALARVTRREIPARLAGARLPPNDNAILFLRRELGAGLREGYAHDFDHWPEAPNEASGVLWLRRASEEDAAPLAEQVEQVVAALLQKHARLSPEALEDAVLAELPDWLTPEIELVEAAAQAYALLTEGVWVARTDQAAEHAHALEVAIALGERLGFAVQPGRAPIDLAWEETRLVPGSASGAVAAVEVRERSHSLILPAQASFRQLAEMTVAPVQGVVLVPPARAPLVREMARRWPLWTKRFLAEGWRFLQIEVAERALAWQDLERRHWNALLGLGPQSEMAQKQLELF